MIFLVIPTIPPVAKSFIIPIGIVAIRVGIPPYFASLLGSLFLFKYDLLGAAANEDFKPVIDYYNANLNKYTTLVFFTDGYAPLDTFKPMRQMMWVITSNGHKTQKYPGHTIFIP